MSLPHFPLFISHVLHPSHDVQLSPYLPVSHPKNCLKHYENYLTDLQTLTFVSISWEVHVLKCFHLYYFVVQWDPPPPLTREFWGSWEYMAEHVPYYTIALLIAMSYVITYCKDWLRIFLWEQLVGASKRSEHKEWLREKRNGPKLYLQIFSWILLFGSIPACHLGSVMLLRNGWPCTHSLQFCGVYTQVPKIVHVTRFEIFPI